MRPVSPVSYHALTYSAVKGIFESILWGPAVEIKPAKVEIYAPVLHLSASLCQQIDKRGSRHIPGYGPANQYVSQPYNTGFF